MISPYVRRLRLAAELRALRTEVGLTHQQLAAKIGQSRAQISRLENGHLVDQDDVMKILDALGVDGDHWTTVMTIAREAGERGWWDSIRGMGARQARCADLEAGAQTIREYQMTFVPGLLQTPAYTRARAEFEQRAGRNDFQTDKVVEARLGRQRMLRRPGGPIYEVIIDEAAIRRLAAPAEIVKEQLYNLAATVNASTTISVRLLPVSATVEGYALPRSAFSIYTFADPGDPVVVTVDTITNDLVLTAPPQVPNYEALYERLRVAALSVDDTLQFLIDHAKTLRS